MPLRRTCRCAAYRRWQDCYHVRLGELLGLTGDVGAAVGEAAVRGQAPDAVELAFQNRVDDVFTHLSEHERQYTSRDNVEAVLRAALRSHTGRSA